ncbi:MAG: glycosyltransferase family 4 protein [Anaerolineae bacterium]|nr:glycosyltransferase family 4 protein [Anaerolineae bacterium]
MKKLVVLTNELPPYRRPIFERLGCHDGLEVKVYLSTRKEPHRLWNDAADLPHVTVRTIPNIAAHFQQNKSDRLIHFPLTTLVVLVRERPDVIISSEFGFRTLMAWLYCVLFRKPLIIWSGETARGAATAIAPQRILRRFLAARASGFLAYGEAARDYLHSLSVDDRRISILTQAIDNRYWIEAARTADADKVRQAHKLSGRTALCVGGLLYRKGIHHLIKAWAALPDEFQRGNSLLLVGGGDEKERLEALSRGLDTHNVIFAGPISPRDLPAYYAAADLFVLPSLLDVWGLVVNEAMASGLPVLCSRYAGCAEELIVPGQTGEVFDPADTAAFSDLLVRWLQSSHKTPDSAIQAHIQQWNFESSVRGILERLAKVGIHVASEPSASN